MKNQPSARRGRLQAEARRGVASEPAPLGPARDPTLLVLFFLSGATSLVYETLWARQLHLFFGTGQLAVSTVLAAFMGGLAVGGLAAARWVGRVRNPLAVYAVIEAFIAAYALVYPALQDVVEPLYLALVASRQPAPLAAASIQALLAGLLLLPPTVGMGATLPLLARLAAAEPGVAGVAAGRLYGANTLGAVLGTGLAGFVLLPSLGLSATTRWTAAANGLIALAAGIAARTRRPQPELDAKSVAVPAQERPRERPERIPVVLSILAALTGFTGLLYEVSWFRLLCLVLGGSAYAFSLMLLAFLLGLGLGGWIGGAAAVRSFRRGGLGQVLGGLAALQLGVAALSWGAMYAYGELPYAWVWLYFHVEGDGLLFWLGQLALALAIMTPPAILMGASFPFLIQLASVRTGSTARAVGMLYGANTLGAIAGAMAGSLLLLPALEVRGSVLLAVAVNTAVALAALFAAMEPGPRAARRRWGYATIAVAVVAAATWARPPWHPLLMTSGVYRYARELMDADAPAGAAAMPTRAALVERAVGRYELLSYEEGLSSVVTVARTRENGELWLAVNGKVDASTGSDLKTQVLLAHLAFAYRPRAAAVLVIGLGSGITAGSITLHPGVRSIDVVEIEPAVVRASRFFDRHNHRPLDDPRVRLVVDDARSQLLLAADRRWDVVSSEPSNPWLTGVSNLFTREFFELGKRQLTADGVWVQWLHGYEMASDDLRSLLATFADVFPEVALFRVGSSDLVLLGSGAPLVLDAAAIGSGLAAHEPVARDLAAVGIGQAEDLVAHYLFGRDAILELAGDVERNTDDNMRIEYSAPLHLRHETRAANDRMLLGRAELPVEAVNGVMGLVGLAQAYSGLTLDGRAAWAMATASRLAQGGALDDRTRTLLEAEYRSQ